MFLQSLRLYRADKPKKNYSFLYREKNRVHRFLSNGRPKDVGTVKGGEKKNNNLGAAFHRQGRRHI